MEGLKRVIIRRRIRRVVKAGDSARPTKLVDKAKLDSFSPAILGLGDVSVPAREVEAIAAIFDLVGFTRFCTQVDPQLAVPKFLSQFLDWLFDKIKTGLTAKNYGDKRELWAELPILAKFLGDGVLFLWNTKGMSENLICNMVTTLYGICYAYKRQFYPKISMAVDKPPAALKCGMARGRVFSVGNGKDYVGHCINTASRLQGLGLITFCFPHRGFNIREHMPEQYREKFTAKSITIRGIGENEVVWLLKEEYNKLPEKARGMFRNT